MEQVSKHVLAGFDDKTYDELSKDFQVLIDAYSARTFGISLTLQESQHILLNVLPKVEWVGVECYAVESAFELAIKLNETREVILESRENIRSLFNYLNKYKSKGQEEINIHKKCLETVAGVVKEINEEEQMIRDASLELEAKRHGISVEDYVDRIQQ